MASVSDSELAKMYGAGSSEPACRGNATVTISGPRGRDRDGERHLNIMKEVGLATVVKDGRFMIYSLAGASVEKGMLELAHPSGAKVALPLE